MGKMKIGFKDYRVRAGDRVKLKKWPTRVKPVYGSKDHYQELLKEHVDRLSSLQRLPSAT
jgi:hypothetical protein